jgi:hypothetical protein
VVITPPVEVVAPGQSFSVAINGQSFGETVDGGGLTLTFNPAVVHVSNVTVNSSVWSFDASGGTIDNVGGTVQNIAFASFTGPTGNFPIATVTFQVIAAGSSSLTLSTVPSNPFGSGGQVIPVTFAGSTLTACSHCPIPLWGVGGIAIGMVASGLRGLRRKDSLRKRAA